MASLSALLGTAPTTTHKPTLEQQAIIDAAANTKDNLLVRALAGAAKTSTLVMVANHPKMLMVSMLCLAFNKKIATEMSERLPSNCVAMTVNSLGHRVWGQRIGMRLNVSTRKNGEMLKLIFEKQKKDVKEELYSSYGDLIKLLGKAKNAGWVPDACTRPSKRLMDDEEFFGHLDEELNPQERAALRQALLLSIDQAFSGKIDFDDQIYMPTCFGGNFPTYPLTLVDEAQDLSLLNHQMLAMLVRSNRLIAVGDPFQAIYAFRGAHEHSMGLLQERFSMRELGLSISFRCPRRVIEEAHWRAPHMTAPEWAQEGSVCSLEDWSIDDLPQDAVIICRNNAPIFSMAIRLLANGRYPQILGNDIGKMLTKVLTKFGPPEMSIPDAQIACNNYELHRLSRTRPHAQGGVKDFCQCLRIFLGHGDNLGAAIAYAEHVINMTGPIRMMTGHKSKGLEFNNVFILDKHLCRLDDEGQDRNLLYVMQTRAQRNLTYVYSAGFVSDSTLVEDTSDE